MPGSGYLSILSGRMTQEEAKARWASAAGKRVSDQKNRDSWAKDAIRRRGGTASTSTTTKDKGKAKAKAKETAVSAAPSGQGQWLDGGEPVPAPASQRGGGGRGDNGASMRGDTYSPQSMRGDPYAPQTMRGDPYAPQTMRDDPYAPQPMRGDTYCPQSMHTGEPWAPKSMRGGDTYAPSRAPSQAGSRMSYSPEQAGSRMSYSPEQAGKRMSYTPNLVDSGLGSSPDGGYMATRGGGGGSSQMSRRPVSMYSASPSLSPSVKAPSTMMMTPRTMDANKTMAKVNTEVKIGADGKVKSMGMAVQTNGGSSAGPKTVGLSVISGRQSPSSRSLAAPSGPGPATATMSSARPRPLPMAMGDDDDLNSMMSRSTLGPRDSASNYSRSPSRSMAPSEAEGRGYMPPRISSSRAPSSRRSAAASHASRSRRSQYYDDY